MNAAISTCGKYRYSLHREFLTGAGLVVFIMLNPSTADATVDDPTIRRCIRFARDWGYASLEVVNLYAYRATNPSVMFAADDPIGPDNDTHIIAAVARSNLMVAAWGARAKPERVAAVRKLLYRDVHCLGLTNGKQPKHPLFARADASVVLWQ